MRRTLLAFCLLAVGGMSLWWLAHPPRGDANYRERAAQTVESLRSYVATSRLWAREVRTGRALHSAAAIAFEEASTGADSTASTFSSWVPPRDLDDLRAKVGDVASAATDALGELHVAAEQDEWGAVGGAQRSLRALELRLTRVASEARP